MIQVPEVNLCWAMLMQIIWASFHPAALSSTSYTHTPCAGLFTHSNESLFGQLLFYFEFSLFLLLQTNVMRSSRLAWSMPFIILYASATFPLALLLSKLNNNPALFNVTLYERLSVGLTHFLCPSPDDFYFCYIFEIRRPKVNMNFKVRTCHWSIWWH